VAFRGWPSDCRQHFQNVFALQKCDALVAVLGAEAFNDAAARFLCVGCERVPLI
jgi:hypothetical protein